MFLPCKNTCCQTDHERNLVHHFEEEALLGEPNLNTSDKNIQNEEATNLQNSDERNVSINHVVPPTENNDTRNSRSLILDRNSLDIEEVANDNVEGRDVLDLSGYLNPEIPLPDHTQQNTDGDGWEAIDRVGGWASFLCQFEVLEEVPSQHEASWAWAWTETMGRIQMYEEGKELDRALMWLSFLPQALLRKARRGGRAGRGNVAQRFNCLSRNDWGALVDLWEIDVRLASEDEKGSNRISHVINFILFF